jgi:hypothetical protein
MSVNFMNFFNIPSEEIDELCGNHNIETLPDYQLGMICDELCGTGSRSDCDGCPLMNEKVMRVNDRCDDRDVYHNGSIIKGGGVSRPEWMDNDQWGEYRMSPEYAYEMTHNDSQFDEPDYDDMRE